MEFQALPVISVFTALSSTAHTDCARPYATDSQFAQTIAAAN